METGLPGLFVYPDFIDEARETQLMKEIDSQTWIVDYLRRLQYYGYRNELEKPYPLIPFPVAMPPLLHQLSVELVEQKIIDLQPDQVIINEYVPGEGIKPHKDRAYYENQICGVNLGSICVMRFIKGIGHEVFDIEIPRRSIYVMQDDARKKWKHAIPPRKKDKIDGEVHHRDRRVSITYRKVKPKQVHPIDPNGKVARLLQEKFSISAEQIAQLSKG
ncbi:alpha-ketoglutarate-dependent dioxygenase AlkB [Mucilaginibacter sp. 21P]|uniref:alpha-ketoglutarate-dependent dioxygenase AlkB n=1 Tax=Mucilaginibacter sp. 21P TaxID=2778902 RepID=UPI001C58A3D5|nr:alpha-ketoglutarate-dependent dioxygenase AlkB [Mucilaginibacter sp. 21P]QXV66829.1 alpha-ketoglutarate-dependent dioxygenase AlkB [Mucilaginibacter sp. 21P]